MSGGTLAQSLLETPADASQRLMDTSTRCLSFHSQLLYSEKRWERKEGPSRWIQPRQLDFNFWASRLDFQNSMLNRRGLPSGTSLNTLAASMECTLLRGLTRAPQQCNTWRFTGLP
ncbi:uncharacterized protein VTP21DRAFT_4967 [Calcarisporiella thermophila]|uniref:uncharacterized protein n=1 Tax=Calcarisporiella thermophila TaxID=911321 RepID=UPI003741FC89